MYTGRVLLLMLFLVCMQSNVVCASAPTKEPLDTLLKKHSTLQQRKDPKRKTQSGIATLPEPVLSPAQEAAKKHYWSRQRMRRQRAWIYSAILPGLGQAYNGDYWRVAGIYAVFAGLGWGAIYSHGEYIKEKYALIEGQGSTVTVNMRRKQRDLSVIFSLAWYVANIFDAYVGASLKTFDLSKDIGIKVYPTFVPTSRRRSLAIGIGFQLNFKG